MFEENGYVGDEESQWFMLLEGTLQAFAGGTFLFVTFCEVIQDEFSHSHSAGGQKMLNPLLRSLALCCGFAFIAISHFIHIDE